MHVHDSALKNGKGHASLYHLMPLRWGFFRGEAHVLWTGWQLKPHNLFERTPLLSGQ